MLDNDPNNGIVVINRSGTEGMGADLVEGTRDGLRRRRRSQEKDTPGSRGRRTQRVTGLTRRPR